MSSRVVPTIAAALLLVSACGTLKQAERNQQTLVRDKQDAEDKRLHDADALDSRGREQLGAGQYAEAQRSFEAAQKLSFKPERMIAIAEIYEARKLYCDAKARYTRFHDQYGARGGAIIDQAARHRDRMRTLCPDADNTGIADYKNKNYEAARRALTRSIIRGLTAKHQRVYLALTYEQLGDRCLASELYQVYLKRQPQGAMLKQARAGFERTRCSADELLARSDAAKAAGEHQRAIQYVILALRHEPSRIQLHWRLSGLYLLSHETCNAEASVKRFVDSGAPGVRQEMVTKRHRALRKQCTKIKRDAAKQYNAEQRWHWPFG